MEIYMAQHHPYLDIRVSIHFLHQLSFSSNKVNSNFFLFLCHLVPSLDSSSLVASSTHNSSAPYDTVDSPLALDSVGLLKRSFYRIASICSKRTRPTDQEKAILIVLIFFAFTAACAAFLQTCLRW